MKTTMRKLLAMLLSAALLTGAFAGCSEGGQESSAADSGTSSTVSASETGESSEENSSASDGEVVTLKIMGIDKTATVDSGEISLSDWVAGGSPIYDAFVEKLSTASPWIWTWSLRTSTRPCARPSWPLVSMPTL